MSFKEVNPLGEKFSAVSRLVNLLFLSHRDLGIHRGDELEIRILVNFNFRTVTRGD